MKNRLIDQSTDLVGRLAQLRPFLPIQINPIYSDFACLYGSQMSFGIYIGRGDKHDNRPTSEPPFAY